MSSDETYFVIKGGKVSQVREVEVSSVRLGQFMEKLADQAPQEVCTPPLPVNTVRYIKTPFRGTYAEVYTIYSPPQLLTISYRARRHSEADHTLYDVSFPGMLFKFTFDSRGTMGKPMLAIVKTRPQRDQERLYKPHIPNVFNDGGNDGEICMTPINMRGDPAKSCTDTIMNFFTGQPFNDDLNFWPPTVSDFEQWQEKTKENARWIEEAEWEYWTTFGEWSKKPGRLA